MIFYAFNLQDLSNFEGVMLFLRNLHPFHEVWWMSAKRIEKRTPVSPPHPPDQRSRIISAHIAFYLDRYSGYRHRSTERSMEKARRWYCEEGRHGNPTLSSFNSDRKTQWPNSTMCCLDSCFSETPVSEKPVYYADSRTMNFIPHTFPQSVREILSYIHLKSCVKGQLIPLRKQAHGSAGPLYSMSREKNGLHHLRCIQTISF